MQGSSHATWLANEVQFAMGAGQIPSLEKGQKEKHAFPLGGAAIWVMNNDQTRNALKDVRAFLDYLASDEVQGELHKKTASVSVSVTLPLALQEFYKDHPVHQAVISQTIEATLGEHSYGIRMPDYLKTRLALFDLIEKIVDVQNTPDDKVDDLLAEFDKTYSIPEPK